jgi:hypothetical protein
VNAKTDAFLAEIRATPEFAAAAVASLGLAPFTGGASLAVGAASSPTGIGGLY